MNALPIHPGTPPPVPSVKAPQKVTDAAGVDSRRVENREFRSELEGLIRPKGLEFSRHAKKRLEMRGIQLTPDGLDRIEKSVDQLAEKGSRDALVMAGNMSLVVSVTNRTVVTVMNTDSMKESVVTNIDSAVFA